MFLGLIAVSSIVSAINIDSNAEVNYRLFSVTGNESIYFDVDFDGQNLTATEKFKTSLIREECVFVKDVKGKEIFEVIDGKNITGTMVCKNATYTQPPTLPVKNDKAILTTLTKIIDTFYYTIPEIYFQKGNFIERFFIGFNTIELVGDTSFSQNESVNITEESGFAHINISATAPYNNLLLHWNFDMDDNITVYDFTENNNDGTYENNSKTALGVYGLGYSGNTSITWAEFSGADPFNTAQGTVTAWFRTFGPNAFIWATGDEASGGFYIRLAEINGEMSFVQTNSDTNDAFTAGSGLADGGFHHVALLSDGSKYQVYLDGVNQTLTFSSGSNTGDWFSDTSNRDNFVVGILKRTSATNSWNGTIDDVMLFDIALNSSQVLDIYNNQSARFATQGNISFWNLESGANTTVNISIGVNQTLLEGEINGSINGETEFRFSDGRADVINFTNAGEFNLTLILYAGNQTHPFYSPAIGGNITIEPFLFPPPPPPPFWGPNLLWNFRHKFIF